MSAKMWHKFIITGHFSFLKPSSDGKISLSRFPPSDNLRTLWLLGQLFKITLADHPAMWCIKTDLVRWEEHRDRSDLKSGTFNMLDWVGPISQRVWCPPTSNENAAFWMWQVDNQKVRSCKHRRESQTKNSWHSATQSPVEICDGGPNCWYVTNMWIFVQDFVEAYHNQNNKERIWTKIATTIDVLSYFLFTWDRLAVIHLFIQAVLDINLSQMHANILLHQNNKNLVI